MSELSDEVLIAQSAKGSAAALSILFKRYQVSLYNYFLKMTVNQAASEDLTQQLFLRVMKYARSFNAGNGSFQAWLFHSARNLYLDYCRTDRRVKDRFQQLSPQHEEIFIADEGYGEGDYRKLEDALAKLSAEQREIIILSRYQRMKYEEIASVLDISVAAVKVRVHRTINELREIYFNE